MTTIYMYKGDLQPPIEATLRYPDGTIVSLIGATVKFQLVEEETNVTIINKTAGVVGDPANGVVSYDWATGDTDLDKEKYRARFEVTFAGGKKQTFPRKDNFYIEFREKKGV